jgi:glutamine synthetase
VILLSVIDDVLKYIATNEIRWIDFHFFDITGMLHKTTISNRKIEEDSFGKGIHVGDLEQVFGKSEQGELSLLPDPDTLARLPWEPNTVRLISDVIVSVTGERFLKDSRYVAQRIDTNLQAAGIKNCKVGTSNECYIFDTVTTDRTGPGRGSGTILDSREATWGPSPLSSIRKGAWVSQPYDSMYSARTQICETLEDSFGMSVDAHMHGRSATAQQLFEINQKPLKTAADAVTTLKFVVRNLANAVNASSTFMPYPIEGEKGNAMNIAVSFWKTADNNVFYDGKSSYAQISQTGRYFIGGLLEHAAALSLFTAPTPNSYRRLAADPPTIGWSATDSSALVKVPYFKKNVKESKRIVYAGGDSSANSHLAISTVVAAGLDGIKSKIDPGDPAESERKKKRAVTPLPTSLYEAIEALESDTKFIKGVIPSELLGDYLDMKLEEHRRERKAVSGYELEKYYNV